MTVPGFQEWIIQKTMTMKINFENESGNDEDDDT